MNAPKAEYCASRNFLTENFDGVNMGGEEYDSVDMSAKDCDRLEK